MANFILNTMTTELTPYYSVSNHIWTVSKWVQNTHSTQYDQLFLLSNKPISFPVSLKMRITRHEYYPTRWIKIQIWILLLTKGMYQLKELTNLNDTIYQWRYWFIQKSHKTILWLYLYRMHSPLHTRHQ